MTRTRSDEDEDAPPRGCLQLASQSCFIRAWVPGSLPPKIPNNWCCADLMAARRWSKEAASLEVLSIADEGLEVEVDVVQVPPDAMGELDRARHDRRFWLPIGGRAWGRRKLG